MVLVIILQKVREPKVMLLQTYYRIFQQCVELWIQIAVDIRGMHQVSSGLTDAAYSFRDKLWKNMMLKNIILKVRYIEWHLYNHMKRFNKEQKQCNNASSTKEGLITKERLISSQFCSCRCWVLRENQMNNIHSNCIL